MKDVSTNGDDLEFCQTQVDSNLLLKPSVVSVASPFCIAILPNRLNLLSSRPLAYSSSSSVTVILPLQLAVVANEPEQSLYLSLPPTVQKF